MLPKYWYNSEGHRFDIVDMSTDHIENAIIYLENRIEGEYPSTCIITYGQMMGKGPKWAMKEFKRWADTRIEAFKRELGRRKKEGIDPIGDHAVEEI